VATSSPEPLPAADKPEIPPHLLLPAGFLAVALESDLLAAWLLPSSAGNRGLRAAHLTIAPLQLLGLGALLAFGVAGFARLRARRKVPAFAPIFLGALILGFLVLAEDLGGVAEKLSEKHAHRLLPLLVTTAAAGLATFLALAARFGARLRRVPALVLGLGLGAANPLLLPHDYPGIHLTFAVVAGCLVAAGLAGLRARVPGPRLLQPVLGAVLVAALAVPVPNAVTADMLRSTGTVMAPFLSRFRGAEKITAKIPPAWKPWFSARRELAPIKPRGPRLLPGDGVVVLITVDALRADVILSGKHDAQLPNLKALKEQGVLFTRARAPGAQTVPVVTGLMTGKYYSQIFWSGGTANHGWSEGDESPRFPELLQASGVRTITMPTLPEVSSAHGTVRGFDEDRPLRRAKGEPSPHATTITAAIVSRLKRGEDEGPLFVYAHYVDPHNPYTRGGTDCRPFDCYVREVALVDTAIGEIRAELDKHYRGRSVLIVSADHGEAFGEHDQRYHATTLYEELLRVPLMVYGADFPPHRVDTEVTLLDLGPTILEMYGQPTPGAFMGESLVRLLRGEPDTLTRPIAADSGRLMQALIFPDGMKLIRNNRNHTHELYDLRADPGELKNLHDTAPDAAQRRALLDALFSANVYSAPGYKVPYRK
jgi:arylsulfatase A-like enzyme